jgi:hypothetical protein
VKKLAALVAAVLLLAVGGCTAAVLLVGGAGVSQAAHCAPVPTSVGATLAAADGAHTGGALPASIGRYRGEQIANAAQILLAGRDLGVDLRGQTVAVMTAIGESSLLNVDHGDKVGPDSRGLFQQRANGAWGSYADRMNPRTAATNFLKALLRVPGWQSMPPTLAAHTVQHNADPYYYEPFWNDAVLVVGTLSGDPNLAAKLPASAELPCAPSAGGAFTGPGGSFGPETCSLPDPTTGRGCLTARMASLAAQLQAQGWSISCWDAHAWNPTSDHPLGRACDVFPGKGGTLPTAAQKVDGDALAATLQATAAQTGVSYLIWYGRIWSTDRAGDGWRPYNGGGVYDPGSITGGHYDHLHISVQ